MTRAAISQSAFSPVPPWRIGIVGINQDGLYGIVAQLRQIILVSRREGLDHLGARKLATKGRRFRAVKLDHVQAAQGNNFLDLFDAMFTKTPTGDDGIRQFLYDFFDDLRRYVAGALWMEDKADGIGPAPCDDSRRPLLFVMPQIFICCHALDSLPKSSASFCSDIRGAHERLTDQEAVDSCSH